MSGCKKSYSVYMHTHTAGSVPSVWDERKMPCVFDTRIEAEREIADNIITRLQEFIDGERDFEGAMTVDEYIVAVTIQPDGSIVDEDGRRYA